MSLKVNNTVFVDPVNGSDCKGKVESPEHPFQTIQVAVKKAKKHLTGTIVIKLRPGIYYAGDFKAYNGFNFKGSGSTSTIIYGRILAQNNDISFNKLAINSWDSPVIIPFNCINSCPQTYTPPIFSGIQFSQCLLNSTWTEGLVQNTVGLGRSNLKLENNDVMLTSWGLGQINLYDHSDNNLEVKGNNNSINLTNPLVLSFSGGTESLTQNQFTQVTLTGNNTLTISGSVGYFIQNLDPSVSSTIIFGLLSFSRNDGKQYTQFQLTPGNQLIALAYQYQIICDTVTGICAPLYFYSFQVTYIGNNSANLESNIYRFGDPIVKNVQLVSGQEITFSSNSGQVVVTPSGSNRIKFMGQSLTLMMGSGGSTTVTSDFILADQCGKKSTSVTVPTDTQALFTKRYLWTGDPIRLVIYYSYQFIGLPQIDISNKIHKSVTVFKLVQQNCTVTVQEGQTFNLQSFSPVEPNPTVCVVGANATLLVPFNILNNVIVYTTALPFPITTNVVTGGPITNYSYLLPGGSTVYYNLLNGLNGTGIIYGIVTFEINVPISFQFTDYKDLTRCSKSITATLSKSTSIFFPLNNNHADIVITLVQEQTALFTNVITNSGGPVTYFNATQPGNYLFKPSDNMGPYEYVSSNLSVIIKNNISTTGTISSYNHNNVKVVSVEGSQAMPINNSPYTINVSNNIVPFNYSLVNNGTNSYIINFTVSEFFMTGEGLPFIGSIVVPSGISAQFVDVYPNFNDLSQPLTTVTIMGGNTVYLYAVLISPNNYGIAIGPPYQPPSATNLAISHNTENHHVVEDTSETTTVNLTPNNPNFTLSENMITTTNLNINISSGIASAGTIIIDKPTSTGSGPRPVNITIKNYSSQAYTVGINGGATILSPEYEIVIKYTYIGNMMEGYILSSGPKPLNNSVIKVVPGDNTCQAATTNLAAATSFNCSVVTFPDSNIMGFPYSPDPNNPSSSFSPFKAIVTSTNGNPSVYNVVELGSENIFYTQDNPLPLSSSTPFSFTYMNNLKLPDGSLISAYATNGPFVFTGNVKAELSNVNVVNGDRTNTLIYSIHPGINVGAHISGVNTFKRDPALAVVIPSGLEDNYPHMKTTTRHTFTRGGLPIEQSRTFTESKFNIPTNVKVIYSKTMDKNGSSGKLPLIGDKNNPIDGAAPSNTEYTLINNNRTVNEPSVFAILAPHPNQPIYIVGPNGSVASEAYNLNQYGESVSINVRNSNGETFWYVQGKSLQPIS